MKKHDPDAPPNTEAHSHRAAPSREGKDAPHRLFEAMSSLNWAQAEKEAGGHKDEWGAIAQSPERMAALQESILWGGLAFAAGFDEQDPLPERRAEFAAWWAAMESNETLKTALKNRLLALRSELGSPFKAVAHFRFLSIEGVDPKARRQMELASIEQAVAPGEMQASALFETLLGHVGALDDVAQRQRVFAAWAGRAHEKARIVEAEWAQKKNRVAQELGQLIDAGWVRAEDLPEAIKGLAQIAKGRAAFASDSWGESHCLAFGAAALWAGADWARSADARASAELIEQRASSRNQPGAAQWAEARGFLVAAIEAAQIRQAVEAARQPNPGAAEPMENRSPPKARGRAGRSRRV